MNLRQQIKKHDEMAAFYARQGLSKLARLELLRAGELRTAQQIKRECKEEDQ